MIENGIKRLWSQGKPALNGWLSIADPFVAEIMAAQGYDSVTIDLQHGVIDYQAAVGMLQAMRASGVTPMVRVPWLDPAAVMKALDAGAFGVICPMIDTRTQAEELVSYVRYPPDGVRSMGPTRANFSAGANYGVEADGQMLCFAMIETRQGFDNLEAIASTPGLDGLYIGPSDLTIGLVGRSLRIGLDREEPEMVEAIQRILAVAHAAGIHAALHCGSPAYAAKAAGWGFDLLTVGTDARLLSAAAGACVTQTRDLIG